MADNEAKNLVPCLRVTQLDALDVDECLVEFLVQRQLDKCIKRLFPEYVAKIKPELRTALYAGLLYCTVGKVQQTVGQKLFGVMLANSTGLGPPPTWKINLLISLETFLYWWEARYNDDYPNFISVRPKIAKFLDVLISAIKLVEICNFLSFIRNGEFSRALLRILGLRIIFDHPDPSPSSLSYTVLSRDILCKGFAEAIMSSLTLFDIPLSKSDSSNMGENGNGLKTGVKSCRICNEWPTHPQEAACGHVFCYYCFSISGWTCRTCEIAAKS